MACSGALKAEFAVLEKKIVDESQNVEISRITPFFKEKADRKYFECLPHTLHAFRNISHEMSNFLFLFSSLRPQEFFFVLVHDVTLSNKQHAKMATEWSLRR